MKAWVWFAFLLTRTSCSASNPRGMQFALFLIAGIPFLAGCGPSGAETAPPAPPPALETARAETRRVEASLPFTGRVEASRSVALRALAEGRVVKVGAGDGAAVGEGRVLFTLGGPRIEAARADLEAAESGARGALEAARSRLDQAKRRAALHLATPGEEAAAAREAADAGERLSRARAALKRFRAALEVKAPVAGLFVGRRVSPGQDVEAGERLGEIMDPSSLRVSAEVFPRPGLAPRAGQAAEIRTARGKPLSAVVTAVQPETGPAGEVRVWITGEELAALPPGTVVRGRIVAAVREKAVTIPRIAVVRDEQERPLVFVGSPPSLEKRMVHTGEAGPDWIEIVSGVKAGERVVTRGSYELYWAKFAEQFKEED